MRPASRPASSPGKNKRQSPSLVRKVISRLLHYPSLGSGVTTTAHLRSLELPGVALLLELIETLEDNPHLTTGALLERFRDHESGRHLAKLACRGYCDPRWGPRAGVQGLPGKAPATGRGSAFCRARSQRERQGRLSDAEKREFARLSGGVSHQDSDGNATSDPRKGQPNFDIIGVYCPRFRTTV